MAAMMSNCGEIEEYAITRSRYIGDVVFPIPYAPELHKNELYSTVADMKKFSKRSLKCPKLPVLGNYNNHLPEASPKWLHIDMSGPSKSQGRATGFGVALLMAIVHKDLT